MTIDSPKPPQFNRTENQTEYTKQIAKLTDKTYFIDQTEKTEYTKQTELTEESEYTIRKKETEQT